MSEKKNYHQVLLTLFNILYDFFTPRLLDVMYLLGRKQYLFPPVPRPSINFNQPRNHLDILRYCREFSSDSVNFELPFLRKIASLDKDSVTLDFGCGLGRLANAFLSQNGICGTYYGWEPERGALDFLHRNYAQFPTFKFSGSELHQNSTYLSGRTGPNTKVHDLAIPDKDVWNAFIKGVKFDLIWTCSVFTHMFPETAAEVLRLFKEVAKPGTWIINTFLCIDEYSEQVLESGRADRTLPFTVNGIRTFSNSNPLVCTAYELGTIKQLYSDAGLPEPEIRRGSWVGGNNGVTYMDLVIVQMPKS